MAATIKDIAMKLGVSHSTVSRALRGFPYVNRELRQRILDAAEELNYRPNALARGLKGMRTRLVGLIIPDLMNDFYASAATIIHAALADQGYRLLLCVSGFSASSELAYLRAMREERVEGLIWVPVADNQAIREYAEEGVPVLQFARMVTRRLDAIVWDDSTGARDATRHLLELGHSRIGLIVGQRQFSSGRVRLEGYRRALMAAGLEVDPQLIRVGPFDRSWGRGAAEELTGLSDPPTALLAASGHHLVGALQAVDAARIRVPEEMSLVGFSNPDWYALWRPPITTVAFPTESMASLAAQTIIQRIADRAAGKEPKPMLARLGCRLVMRGSTAPPGR
ncbi:MAG: LacI family DNA-binding transcriptional regulator [Chloroflexota bacterium]